MEEEEEEGGGRSGTREFNKNQKKKNEKTQGMLKVRLVEQPGCGAPPRFDVNSLETTVASASFSNVSLSDLMGACMRRFCLASKTEEKSLFFCSFVLKSCFFHSHFE